MSKEISRKRIARLSRRSRVRKKIRGTGEKPRLSIYRSLDHIYAQLIDDVSGRTLASVSSLRLVLAPAAEPAADVEEKKGKKKAAKKPSSLKMRRSVEVGKQIALLAREKGLEKVVFDRNGFLYHGRVAALAEAARENGLKF